MMPAFGRMDVCFRRGRRELTRQYDAPSLCLFCQMFRNVGVKCPDISNQAMQESARLKFASGELRYDLQETVKDIRGGLALHDLLRLLFDERVVFLLQAFGKDRHGSRGNMEGAQRPPESLDGGDDLCVLAVQALVEICKGHDLDQVAKSRGFLASQFTQPAIKLPANRNELFTKPTLLIFAARVEVRTVRGARNPAEPVFPAALATDES